MKTRTVLGCVFALLLAFTAARVTYSLVSFRAAFADYRARVDQHRSSDRALDAVASIAIDLETGVRGFLLTGDERFLEPYHRASAARASAVAELERFERGELRASIARRIEEELKGWQERIASPLVTGRARLTDEQRMALLIEGKEVMDRMRGLLGTLRAEHELERGGEAEALTQYRDRLTTEGWALVGVSFLLLAMVTVALSRAVERPLSHLSDCAARIAQGESPPIEASGVAEAQKLARALDDMAKRLGAERARQKRFTDLVSALAAGADVRTVADAALRALAEEHRATAGVVWIRREADGTLELAASSGLDASGLKAGGSALAREAAASCERVRVELPREGGPVVRSAFGELAPPSWIAEPIVVAGRTVAVVELATPAGAPIPDEAGLERSLERIGLALENVLGQERQGQLRQRIAGANEELTAQNEELRAQEEELRTQAEELMRKQAELSSANEALLLASRQKSVFVSSMSHEFRTPLNAILGFTEVLLSSLDGLDERAREQLGHVQAAGQQLLRLVNDALDLAKVEAGRLDVDARPFDVVEVLDDAVQLVRPIAERKRVLVEPAYAQEPVVCTGDPARVRQVVLNLLSNAVKFSPEGGRVRLQVAREASLARISVKDSGPGIREEDQQRLFQPFSQVGAQASEGTEGTGLGLAISRKLVERMGGSIGVSSRPHEGATFFFTLPMTDAEPRVSLPPKLTGASVWWPTSGDGGPPPSSAVEPPVVLLVEDDAAASALARDALIGHGYAAVIAPTAEVALAYLESRVPAALVIDLGLPGMSGFELLDRLSNGPAARVPVVVLTGRDLASDERARLARSAEAVLQKGAVTTGAFVDTIVAVCAKRAAEQRRRVLVVDDSEMNRRVVRAMLGPAGFEVLEANDAASGIALARSEHPSLVLMDLRMPGTDGYEAARTLRTIPETKDVPIVAVSAQAMAEDRERALTGGFDFFLAKPVARQELLAAVARFAHQPTTR